MEPRFGLRCRGVVRCPYVHIRFLKSCLHYCDWTEDALTGKLRCNRFMRFAVSCGRCRRGIGRVRHLQRSLGLLRCDGRPASAQPVGAVRHEKQKTFSGASRALPLHCPEQWTKERPPLSRKEGAALLSSALQRGNWPWGSTKEKRTSCPARAFGSDALGKAA